MKSFSKIVSTHDCLGEYVEVIFAPRFQAVDELAGGSGGPGLAGTACFGIYYDLCAEVTGAKAFEGFLVIVDVE